MSYVGLNPDSKAIRLHGRRVQGMPRTQSSDLGRSVSVQSDFRGCRNELPIQ